MAVLTIDGIQLEVPERKGVLECALEAGIYIPHLCHHPDLPENASCRMCIVEVEGIEGVVPSCTLHAKDGMKVKTKSQRLTKLRSLALELLLAGHPEDCSTCPKYGNCELQTLIQYMGGAGADMKHRVKGFKTQEENPLLVHDMNRCVLCGRCVRACNDLRGVGVLQYQKKDMETYVGALHDKLLIDADCRFCQACAEVCPTGSIRDKLMMTNSDNKPKEEVVVPCRAACPAHTDVPRYIRYIKEGRFDEAAAVIREKVPFPKSLGRICTNVCEFECKRGNVNEAMAIRNLKRYAADQDTGDIWRGRGKQLPDTGKKVCIVGGGPAGMTAAYYLRKQGHDVTLKEALPTIGGMMCYGIPEYRLPREIVAEEYSVIEEAGIHTEVNTRVESPKELRKDYDAVLMAIGTHKGISLPIEGNELKGVLINTEFLLKASLHQETGIGKKVIILGGGNVAFDCARTAKRLGAQEVHLACLEARDKMTASEEEIMEAQEEGIKVYPARSFERITGIDSVTGVDFMKVLSFEFDANRRAVIKKEEGSEQHIDGDTVIFATGQRPAITEDAGLTLGRGNCIAVRERSLMTSEDGMFAAGDAVYGTKTVIQAVASGREAAIEIDRYLGGDGDISEILAPIEKTDGFIGKQIQFGYEKRATGQIVAAEKRQDNFRVIDYGICSEDICKEAGRCLQCDLRLQITSPRLWGDFKGREEDAV
ncbi:MAG TPA: FAD-dependent oxidoreductase [Clostridia bacterium]|nr:FAD-dependent oxidoreductase [Clostridia bacterium]